MPLEEQAAEADAPEFACAAEPVPQNTASARIIGIETLFHLFLAFFVVCSDRRWSSTQCPALGRSCGRASRRALPGSCPLGEARKRIGAAEGQVSSVRLEPFAVAPAVADPVEQDDSGRVTTKGPTHAPRVITSQPPSSSGVIRAKHPPRAQQVKGAPDLGHGDAPVGAEGHQHQMREPAVPLFGAQHLEAFFPSPASARVDAITGPGEIREREQHRGIADRQRRVATGVHHPLAPAVSTPPQPAPGVGCPDERRDPSDHGRIPVKALPVRSDFHHREFTGTGPLWLRYRK